MESHLFWGQKVKSQDHDVCVGLQTERNIAAAAAAGVSYAGFSLTSVFDSLHFVLFWVPAFLLCSALHLKKT